MCGILFSIAFRDTPSSSHDDLIPWISTRGPDSLGTHKVHLPGASSNRGLELTFTSSVLHLQGQNVSKQPLVSNGDVLCWNGEIWNGLEVQDHENDGLKLLSSLTAGKRVWEIMGNIEGPWAMVFYSSKEQKLWYGRDCLGRRSLLWKNVLQTGGLVLSSVGVDMSGWKEVDVDGLWCMDLNDWIKEGQQCPAKLYPWVFEGHQPSDTEEYMVLITLKTLIAGATISAHEQESSRKYRGRYHHANPISQRPHHSALNPHKNDTANTHSYLLHRHLPQSRSSLLRRLRLFCPRMVNSHPAPPRRTN
jgi:asparagine synthetase B (glutamine-hydrolysing)